ncbi:hypothetical protein L7F22_017973 [Adiantum nelumboides]|nr:hypothetical protein [Adiantum nelumboides]
MVKNALRAYLKVDGSLLTSYICPFQHKLKFKSRNMPTYREYEVVERSISEELKAELSKLTSSNVSVDLELTTPDNIVVIEYADYAVHVLKARSTRTGNYIDIRSSEFASQYPTIAAHLVEEIPISQVDVTRTDIEGYVLDMPDSRMVKYKTLSYLSTAAALNALRQRHVDKKTMATSLYKAAADGMLDKVRSLHRLWAAQRQINDFPLTQLLEQLKKVEAFAKETLDRLIQTVETFYKENKHLARSDYARKVKANAELIGPLLPHALMCKYLDKDINFKELAVRLYAHKAPIDTIVEHIMNQQGRSLPSIPNVVAGEQE